MKSSEIFRDAIENRGYSEFDFIMYERIIESTDTKNLCVIRNVNRIEYPIDTEELVEIFENHTPSYIIISDENNAHIFIDNHEGVEEIPYLPSKIKDDSSSDEVEKARQVQDMLNVVLRDSSVLNGPNAISNFLALAAYLSRNNKFEEFCSVNDPFGYIHSIVEDMNKTNPGVLSPDVDDEISFDFIKGLMKMRNLDLTPSRCLGEVYVRAESNRHSESRDFGVTKSTYNLAMSFIQKEDILCYSSSPTYPLIDCFIDGTIVSMHRPNVEFLKYISGSSSEFIQSDVIDAGTYRNIVLFPPWGLKIHDELKNHNIPSEVMIFEQALDNIEEGGSIVALLPAGFLQNKQFANVRRRIIQGGVLRAIIKVDRPMKDVSFSGYLVVVSYSVNLSDQTVYLEDPTPLIEGADPHFYLNMYGGGKDLPEGVRIIDTSTCDEDNNYAIHLELSTNYDGILLMDCADVIHGVQVKSSYYYPDGNIAGIPYLRISNIKDGVLDLKSSKRISSDFATIVTNPGDLVLSINGVVGKCAVVRDEVAVPSSQVVILRPKKFISTETLLRAILSDYVQNQFRMLSANVTIRYISISELKNVRLVL